LESYKFEVVEKANTDKRMRRLDNIVRHKQHMATDVSDSYYTTGQVKFAKGKAAEAGEVYKFTVVGVSNKLATHHDLSYNENMVDAHKTFYPFLKDVTSKSANDQTKVSLPQPYQKYVYDPSGERVVTYGYAMNNFGGAYDGVDGGDGPIHNYTNNELTTNGGGRFDAGDKSIDTSGTKGAIIRRIFDISNPATAVAFTLPDTSVTAAVGSAITSGNMQVYSSSVVVTDQATLDSTTLAAVAQNTAYPTGRIVLAYLAADVTNKPATGDYMKIAVTGLSSIANHASNPKTVIAKVVFAGIGATGAGNTRTDAFYIVLDTHVIGPTTAGNIGGTNIDGRFTVVTAQKRISSIIDYHTYKQAKAVPNADSSGALFCCRTNFTVVVGKTESVISSSVHSHTDTEETGKMVFNTSNVIKASLNNGVYTPNSTVEAAPGQIMIFEANGTRAMVYYNEESREWRAI